MPGDGHPKTCCNARTRKAPDDAQKRDVGEWAGEGYCHRVAGEGTDHRGEGRCRYHGGAHNGRPIEHGLYSTRREELREKLGVAKDLDDPANLRREVDVLRALKAEYLEEIDSPTDSGDIEAITKIDSEIRRMVDTVHKMHSRAAPSQEEIDRLVTGMANVIERFVPESNRADALDELESLVGSGRPLALQDGRTEA